MDDLISRQEAIDAVCREGRNVDSRYLLSERIVHEADAVEALSMLPTIDAVEVIRCKDCRWYGRADKSRFYRGMDCLNKRIATIDPDMNYCSRAERKTDDCI